MVEHMKRIIDEVRKMVCIKCKKCGFVYNKRFKVCPKCEQNPNKPVGTIMMGTTGEIKEPQTPEPVKVVVAKPMEKSFTIQHVSSGQTFDINKDVTTFGRQDNCDIVLGSEKISRLHTKLQKKGNECYIVDCGSVNHTYLNDEVLVHDKAYSLNNGDIFKVFTVQFKFKVTDK